MTTAEQYYNEIKNKRYSDEMDIIFGQRNDAYAKNLGEDFYKRAACYMLVGIYPNIMIGSTPAFKIGVENAKKIFIINTKKDEKKEESKQQAKKDEKETTEEEQKQQAKKDEKETTEEEQKQQAKKDEKETTEEDDNIIDVEWREVDDEKSSEDPKDTIKFNTKSQFIPDEDEEATENEAKKKDAIHFDYDKMNIDLDSNVQYRKANKTIEMKIGKIKEYLINKIPKDLNLNLIPVITGMIELSLSKDNKLVARFMIDPNMIHGNGYYIIGIADDMSLVAVPFKEEELIKKCLAGYTLTKDDIDVCRKYIFINSEIYRYIDLSGDKLKKVTTEEYKSLELQLNKILSLLEGKNLLGRYRLSSYKDDLHFVIKSDKQVKCCCQDSCVTNLTNLTITVKNNEVIISDLNKNVIESFRME